MWRNSKLGGKKQAENQNKDPLDRNNLTYRKAGSTGVFEGKACSLVINNKSSRSGKQYVWNERPHKNVPEPSSFWEKVSIHGVKVEC